MEAIDIDKMDVLVIQFEVEDYVFDVPRCLYIVPSYCAEPYMMCLAPRKKELDFSA